jgi:hypothetical protein
MKRQTLENDGKNKEYNNGIFVKYFFHRVIFANAL